MGSGGAWFRVADLGAADAGLTPATTLILAFSRQGRRDPLAGGGAWFRVAGLAASLWIPAFAGMTIVEKRDYGT